MSKPTIIMIAVDAADDDGISRLKGSLANRVGIQGRLTRVDAQTPEWDIETAVHIGSFNHLDEPLFMQLARDAGWKRPDRLQLFIQRQDDGVLTEYDLFDELVPMRVAEQAVGRGVRLSTAPLEQRQFFSQLGMKGDGPRVAELRTTFPWVFEVLAIHPAYFFEWNARLETYGTHQVVAMDCGTVSQVDLAFEGIGVRWGSREPNVKDFATESAKEIIKTLNPGDLVELEGLVRVGPQGIVELHQVRLSEQPIDR